MMRVMSAKPDKQGAQSAGPVPQKRKHRRRKSRGPWLDGEMDAWEPSLSARLKHGATATANQPSKAGR